MSDGLILPEALAYLKDKDPNELISFAQDVIEILASEDLSDAAKLRLIEDAVEELEAPF